MSGIGPKAEVDDHALSGFDPRFCAIKSAGGSTHANAALRLRIDRGSSADITREAAADRGEMQGVCLSF
jgi:hypothetical protein